MPGSFPLRPTTGMTLGDSILNISRVYNERYQLTQNTAGGIMDHHYTHDPVGNIASIIGIVEAAPVDGTNNYDHEGNRLTEATGQEPAQYIYDDNGNVISDGTQTFVYNQNNRLIRVEQGSTVYFLNDHLGTPHTVIDASSEIVWQAAYLPFGKAQIVTETIVNHFRFPGQYYDTETDLHYNWHRYYDPSLGRYLRADPIGLQGGINLYTYVYGNPVNKFDPTGLFCIPMMTVPVDVALSIDTNWGKWSDWSFSFMATDGPEYPIPWFNATCVCNRKRSGVKTTALTTTWRTFYFCIDKCTGQDYSYSEEFF